MKFNCKACDGTGRVEERESYSGRWQDDPCWLTEVDCPTCDGTGEASDRSLREFWDEFKSYPADHWPATLALIMGGEHRPAFERAMAIDFNSCKT